MKGLLRKNFHWVIVLCCCGFSGTVAGLAVNSMGVFYLPVATDLGVGVGDVTLYLTIMSFVQGLLAPVVVRVMKKMPFRLMIICATALAVLCYVFMSLSTHIWNFYVIAVFLGIATAFTGLIVGNVVIGNWFERRMGIASAIYMCISGVIGAVLNPVFAAIIESAGWRSAYLVAAAIEIVLLLPAIFIIRTTPEEYGMQKYGAGSGPDAKKNRTVPENRRFGLKSTMTVMLFITACVAGFAAGISQHLSGYAGSIGRGAAFGATLMSIAMVGNIVTKLAAGVISDAIGSIRSTIVIAALAAIGCLLLMVFPDSSDFMLYIGAFTCGGFYAITGVTNISMAKERFIAADFAKVIAYLNVAKVFGTASAYALIGYSFDIFGSYNPAFTVCIVIGIICVVCMLVASGLKRTDKS